MKIFLKFIAAVVILQACSCSDPHLITDRSYMQLVDSLFAERKILAAGRSEALSGIPGSNLSHQRIEAMKYLYAFMPLSDLADYTGEFFLANADAALKTKQVTAWGKTIPEDIFLHYVLPCRVNNENLDSFRIVYQDEILSRIKGLTMVDAALEINHWCHEKVAYLPADIRTSAPMSTILSARGRCGEESTFTVAALRTAGIPARQVYTPRWAHTDDNHAWVEIWSDGKWHYFGACEPEPVIDRGWFTEPARRAMLIHTKSFGASVTGEKAVNRYKYFTEVNNLSMYAVTKTVYVRVSDKEGRPASGASVEYQLYNYAEFYPLAVVPADNSGISSFETGLGDLLVWAHDDNHFAFRKITVGETDTLYLVLDQDPPTGGRLDLDLDVPLELSPLPGPTKEQTEKNAGRLARENEIRQNYINSWITNSDILAFALQNRSDTARIKKIVARSMGNYREIMRFIAGTPAPLRSYSLEMLEVLADKDLRDTRAEVLEDHLMNTRIPESADETEKERFVTFVLNPRIANELIKPWRGYFKSNLPEDLRNSMSSDPLLVKSYLEENIKLDQSSNFYRTPLTPAGVFDLKLSDQLSRDICFVAICRSLGIPSRLEPGSNVPQYYAGSEWHDVWFSDRNRPTGKKGFLRLRSSDTKPVPEYYTHFTLARFDNGRYNTLEYDYERKISDFSEELTLAPGKYLVVTGNRLPDSRILASLAFFEIKEGEHKTVEVNLRKSPAEGKPTGKIDLAGISDIVKNSSSSNGGSMAKGMVIMWIDPEGEPTKHIFNDLPHLKKELDDWGGCFLFLTGTASGWQGFSSSELEKLPSNLVTGKDDVILKNFTAASGISGHPLPIVVVTDKNGNVLYASSGYRIGIGEQILRYSR